MGNAPRSLLIFTLFLWSYLGYSQTQDTVLLTNIEMEGNLIKISYDILFSTPIDNYSVRLEVSDSTGNLINARSLEGDIGENVSGGSNKYLLWDIDADNILLDEEVIFKIFAKLNDSPAHMATDPGAVPEREVEEEKPQDVKVQDEIKDLTNAGSFSSSRAGLMLQSLALPGLGLSRLSGKPHWIRGALGYSCIAGSVILNNQAYKTFSGIEDLVDFDEINRAYDKATRQDNTSRILAYTAIGIWVGDILWTFVGTSDIKRGAFNNVSKGFSLASGYDALSHAPMVSVKFKF